MNQPYVYRLDHPATGEFYIGYRAGNKVPAHEDLGHKYFTSSKFVKNRFHEFDVTMILKCDDAQEAYDLEQFLIWADWKKPGMLNKQHKYGKGKWDMSGKNLSAEHRAKMSASHKGKTLSAEHRAKIGSTISMMMKGKPKSTEHCAKMSAAAKGKKFICMLHNKKEYDKSNFSRYFPELKG
jgi:hypothetical protein